MSAQPAASSMRAVVQDRYGEAQELRLDSIPRPAPGPREVLVRVRAASLNPADKFIMRGDPRMVRLAFGLTRPRFPIRGSDVAGIVEAVGEQVDHLRPGDQVFGEVRGSLAEYAVGDASRLAAMPPSLTFEQAAAIPMVGITALMCLRKAGVGEGSRLLVNGAAGGVGTFTVQIAKAWGAQVTAVCSTRNVELLQGLGADRVVDYLKEPLLEGQGDFDVILDNVGNHRIHEMRTMLRPGGALIPNTGEPGPDGTVMVRMAKAAWHHLFSRHRVMMVTTASSVEGLEELSRMVEAGQVTPVIDTMFALEHAADAMARLATRHARGKVVVSVP